MSESILCLSNNVLHDKESEFNGVRNFWNCSEFQMQIKILCLIEFYGKMNLVMEEVSE